jgi:hypothetical protein
LSGSFFAMSNEHYSHFICLTHFFPKKKKSGSELLIIDLTQEVGYWKAISQHQWHQYCNYNFKTAAHNLK